MAVRIEEKSAGGWRRFATLLPKLLLAAILAIAILDMLAGVFLRYVVTAITGYFDWPGVSFFWAEEVGELALCWLTLVGAAVAILERTHFALAVLTHRLPAAAQRAVERVNHLMIAGFGVTVALFGWKVSLLNNMLTTPALEINLAFLYLSSVVGGGLIALYAIGVATGVLRPRQVALETGPE